MTDSTRDEDMSEHERSPQPPQPMSQPGPLPAPPPLLPGSPPPTPPAGQPGPGPTPPPHQAPQQPPWAQPAREPNYPVLEHPQAPPAWQGYGYQPPGPPPGVPPYYQAPRPEPSPRGRGVSALLTAALVAFAALGGGAVGAWTYAQGQDPATTANGGGTTVVDAPQLDYTSLASIASQVSPSVVQIQAGDGSGSGVVMSADGDILTNAHVVELATSGQVLVRFSNGETAPATVVGADPLTDIAVVRAEGVSDLTPAAFGDSDRTLVGDTVLAIGSPFGFEGSVTQGIISAKDRSLPVTGNTGARRSLSGLLQTDASINPGNSGGPLVSLAGEVIGINTAIATDGQSSGFQGLGFAVPSNRAVDVAQQLLAGDEVRHAFLGVSVVSAADPPGALIDEVAPGGPADEAGLQPGDLVTRIGDQQITDSTDLVNAVHAAEPGDALEVEYERNGSSQTTTVTLGEATD